MDDAEQLTPRTSVEKLEAELDRLADVRGEGAGDRMLIQTLKSCIPALRKLGYIPDDPADLDQVLGYCALWAHSMRSDDAPPLLIGADHPRLAVDVVEVEPPAPDAYIPEETPE